MDRNEYIAASELGDYIFCKRGWWLKQHGLLPTTVEMQRGTEKHENLFLRIFRLQILQKLLLWLGILLLIFLIIVLLLL